MIERLTEQEINFLETFYDPVAMSEIMFSDYDNLTMMEGDKLSHLRLAQFPLISHEYLLDKDPNLSEKENFQLRKNAGEVYALGGRLFGKTMIVEKIDMLISIPILGAERVGFSSYDAIHIRGVLEEIIQGLEHHPFYKMFDPQINRSPSYRFSFRNGYVLEGINMNLTGKKPGAQFFQKHLHRLYIEEASFETEDIFRQRRDSVSEMGCIYRIAGMTNFTKYSPCGKVFYDLSRRGVIVNLPQYVNPFWGEAQKKQAIKDFGGEQSMGYRVFIKGEVVEEGVSVFDMERVRRNYNEKRHTLIYEVAKKDALNFQHMLVLERPRQADNAFIFADIGESAPTEIGIIFQIGEKYKYVYNVTLYNLTDKEQYKVFKWIAEKIGANFIALDCTDGTGRAIYRRLEEVFPKEHLIWVGFNEKIPIDFEKDNKGNNIRKSGKFVYIEEFVRDWSIQNLKTLLYGERMDLPLDYKFDTQFNSVISMQSGTRIVYDCVAQEDHLFQAFQVFSIAQWMCEFLLIKPISSKNFCKTGV